MSPGLGNQQGLGNQLVVAERDDVARGVRHLLVTPILHEGRDPELFAVVRARREPIARWFEHYCGWTLTVEPRLGYARLAKIRTDADGRRPARRSRSGRAAFDRRRYTLLCVVAAELLGTPVTTIGLLADRVAHASAVDPAVPSFDTAARSERMAYVDALRLLEELRVVEVLDGATESYVESGDAKVLYRVDATLLLRLLAAPQGASRIAPDDAEGVGAAAGKYFSAGRFDALLAGLAAETRYGIDDLTSETQANLRLRHSVLRRLADDPVLYRAELTEAELAYATSPAGRRKMRDAAEQAGMILEERAEGWLFVDPDAIATDQRFPHDGHANAAALILLDALAASPGGLADEQLVVEAAGILAREPSWAQKYRTEDGATRLAVDAVDVLESFRLARRGGGVVEAMPAAGRYALTAITNGTVTTGADRIGSSS